MISSIFRASGLAMLFCSLLLTGGTEGFAHSESSWPVYELPIGEEYHEGSFFDYRSVDPHFVRDGRQSIHVARVFPGHSYRLGLKLRSDQAKKLSVSLFDRWPYAEDARPIRLATGGGLRGIEGQQEYQWWFSVDKESAGSLLYIQVTVDEMFNSDNSNWKYRLFIVDSPRSPMNSLGRGVVYHRGPTNLKLQENNPSVALSYQPFPIARPVLHVAGNQGWNGENGGRKHTNNLIMNSSFSNGLTHWKLRPERAGGVGVFDGKLRLWSRDSAGTSGIVQRINRDVSGRSTLKLSLDLKISAQTEPFQEGGAAPLTLSVCYEDRQGTLHCGDTAFRKHFVIHPEKKRHGSRNIIVMRPNTWARYAFDLKELNPQPRRLISIELSGSGAPERESWVERIGI